MAWAWHTAYSIEKRARFGALVNLHSCHQGCTLAVCGDTVWPTAQYVLMSIAITLMVPFYKIDVLAPFSAAFTQIPGWGWCQYLVSVGAVFGIGTVLLVRGPLQGV